MDLDFRKLRGAGPTLENERFTVSMDVTPSSPVTDEGTSAQPTTRHARIRVEPGKGWTASLPELWQQRDVVYFLVLRNLEIRYRQTALGGAWAVLHPLGLMGAFVLFAEVINIPSEGVPYALFAFAAIVPWTLFSQSLTLAAESVVRDINLVSKVYVPRLVLPLSAVGALVIDYAIALAILFVMMGLYSTYPDPTAILWLPALTLLTLGVAFAVGFWFSALMVMYRDIRMLVPVLLQIWLIATPIAYPSSLVPEEWQLVYGLNPMAGVVEGFRAALLGTPAPEVAVVAVSACVTAMLLTTGLAYFRRVDRTFADVI
jgi:lipopolysaccharide transport system permease protein